MHVLVMDFKFDVPLATPYSVLYIYITVKQGYRYHKFASNIF